MPAWWGKKSSKNKDQSPRSSSSSLSKSTPIINKPSDKKPKSFDEVSAVIFSRNSPRSSKDYTSPRAGAGGSSGFSGFDSDSGEKTCHPLPRPQCFTIDHHAVGIGSGSGSVSSVSSSGSSDDHLISQDHGQLSSHRGLGDSKIDPRSRSPGPGSRGPTSPTSPLHPRFCGFNLMESPAGKVDDGKSQCHRLPLPPGSPTSPSSLPNPRTNGVTENSTTSTQPKWKKGRLLGRGTFGHVYLGFNSVNGQMCAIKEVRLVSDDQTSKECLKQLNQEINLLSQLSHPNIVRYYGSEMVDEALSVYLEYVSGGSIHKLLQEYGPFKEPVIQNYTRQIISGLAYLHGRNTVHRDIKGANILVDPHGEIKLADFGMAKHITNYGSMLSFKGSPYWMAPEVVMNTNGYSLAVDIWSLGCTILEMATSKPPWSKYEGVAAIFKIGNSKEIPEIPNHLSSDAKSFIKLCLQRDPSARPTASHLLDHPFVRDQMTPTSKAASVNVMTMDAFPLNFEGIRTPPILDHHPTRKSISSCDNRDFELNPVPRTSRAMRGLSENARMITSLPVSPCSSPLRQYRSNYLSPPHPSFPTMAQGSYNVNYSSHAVRPIATLDPWQESSLFRVQAPGGSPRTRLI